MPISSPDNVEEDEEFFSAILASTAVGLGVSEVPSSTAQDGWAPYADAAADSDSYLLTSAPKVDPYNDWVSSVVLPTGSVPINPDPVYSENSGSNLGGVPATGGGDAAAGSGESTYHYADGTPVPNWMPINPGPVYSENSGLNLGGVPAPSATPQTPPATPSPPAVAPTDEAVTAPADPSPTSSLSLQFEQNSSPAPLSNDQPGRITQILSGTYAESVLQTQLANQRQVPGSFVSPAVPYDYLFNPNATSLAGAALLASHSPNTQLLQAYEMQLWASMTPIVGSVATWMNPRSSGTAKGIAGVTGVLGVVPLASALGRELGTLGPELGTLGSELESEANLQHVLTGGSGDRGIAVLHLDVSEMSKKEINDTIAAVRDMDLQAGFAGGLPRTDVNNSFIELTDELGQTTTARSGSVARSVRDLGRDALSLDETPGVAAGHIPDVTAGGSPLGPIMGQQSSVNSSIGGQWIRYGFGFTFDGFSLIDRETGEFLYISQGLENEPVPILGF